MNAPSRPTADPKAGKRKKKRRRSFSEVMRGWPGLLVCIAIIGFTALSTSLQGPRLNAVGAMVADAYQRAAPRAYDPQLPVRVVAIDGESLARYGQWPWPRTYVAELVQRLQTLGAAAIAFDVLFAEPDRTSPELIAESTRRFEPGAPPVIRMRENTQHDIQLARVIGQAPVALGAVQVAQSETARAFEQKFGLVMAGSDPRDALARNVAVEGPLPLLVENASGYGLAGVGVGDGGVVRRAQLFATVGGQIAPSLAMEALRVAQQARGYILRSSDSSAENAGGAAPVVVEARNGAVTIPLTPDGAMWVHYAGPQDARIVPAWRVLEGEAPDPALGALLAGQIVFVGATAPGLRYLVDTPLAPAVDAVTVHAEVLEQVLSGVSLQRPDWAVGVEILAIVVFSVLVFLFTTRGSALVGASVAALALAALFYGAWIAFRDMSLILSPVQPAIAVAGNYVALTALAYVRSRRESGAVRNQFARFVAPEIIAELSEDPENALRAGGDARELTVLFCDARGFTTLSETMPPDELITYLNTFLAELSDEVLKTGGTIDKYIGDCVMAFWNAPLEMDDHIDRSLAATFAINAAEARLNERFAAQGQPSVAFGVGVNTGPANVGLMGSPTRMEYSCVGDTVNVSARLQDLTKAYGVWNVVGAHVVEGATAYEFLALDDAPIRGRKAAEKIYTAVRPKGEAPTDDIAALQMALDAARLAPPGPAFEAALETLRGCACAGVDVGKLADALEKRRRAV